MAKKPASPTVAPDLKGTFEERHKTLLARVDNLFSTKQPFMSLCQDIAENFYPERANFTYSRNVGDEFATNLATSYPLLIRRDLGNSMSSMLRPEGEQWLHMTTGRPDDEMDHAARVWLEDKTLVQTRAMSDPAAFLTKATNLTDHDWVTFGNAVMSVEVNRRQSALLYRNWHLRDMAWCERYDGSIGLRARNWKPTVRDVTSIFKDRVHPNVTRKLTENNGSGAYTTITVRHVVVPSEEYDGPNPRNRPWISLFIDVDNKHVMEEVGLLTGYYIIPRWFTPDDSQYGRSPAVTAALPDARLMQQMTFTLLKAGEKAADPPMAAFEEKFKSPVDMYPGGITWAVGDGSGEKISDLMMPLSIDSRGFPLGIELLNRTQQMLGAAFYIDKLQMLGGGNKEMTAYEASIHLKEYIRGIMPLFQPVEQEYNAPLCEDSFTLLMAEGAFGSPNDVPESLRGQNIRFRFESPISEAKDQGLVQTFQEALALSEQAAAFDPSAGKMLDIQKSLRDTLTGRQVPTIWVRDEKYMEAVAQQQAEQQQAADSANVVQQGAAAAEQVGLASQALQQAAA